MNRLILTLLILLFAAVKPDILQGQKIVEAENIPTIKNLSRSTPVLRSQAYIELDSALTVFADIGSKSTFEEVRTLPEQFVSNIGFDYQEVDVPHWVKLGLKGDPIKDKNLLLLLSSDPEGERSWTTITTYLVRENGSVEKSTTGQEISNEDKSVPSELNLVNISLAKNEKVTIYIMLKGGPENQHLAPDKINAFLVQKELIPGAFDDYPFDGYFIQQDKNNAFNFIYNHEIYIDSDQQSTVEYISSNWSHLNTYDPLDIIQEKGKVYWLKTRLISNPSLVGRQLFQVSSKRLVYHSFAKIDAFTTNGDGKYNHLVAGESVRLKERSYPFWAAVIPIYLNPRDSLDLYIRLEGTEEKYNMGHLLIKHLDQNYLFPEQVNEGIYSGAFFGIFLILAIFFIMLYFVERDKMDLYLLLMVIGSIIALTIGDPNRQFALFPVLRQYAIYAWCVGGIIIMIGFIKFTESYFSYDQVKDHNPYWIPGIIFIGLLVAVIDATYFVDYSKYTYQLSIFSHIVQIYGVVFTIRMAINAPIKHANSKQFYFIAFLPVAVCVSCTLGFVVLGRLPVLGEIPWIMSAYEFVVQNGANIVRSCMIISFMLFALSIGNRTNILKADRKLLQEISEKNSQNEILLKEIHHRVKNNLEVVSSLLELQSLQVDNASAYSAIQASQSRVQSMAIIHQKLYQGKNLASIEMRDYFLNLSEEIMQFHIAQEHVQIRCEMLPIEVDVDTAIPVGLIVNELITNAFKYAFPNDMKGTIELALKDIDNNRLHLLVADNGIGKQNDQGITGTGFGTKLVSLLTKQLNATVRESNDNGTRIEFEFEYMQIS